MNSETYNNTHHMSYNIFRLETKEDQTKYEDIVLDFGYFKISEAQEVKIENSNVCHTVMSSNLDKFKIKLILFRNFKSLTRNFAITTLIY